MLPVATHHQSGPRNHEGQTLNKKKISIKNIILQIQF